MRETERDGDSVYCAEPHASDHYTLPHATSSPSTEVCGSPSFQHVPTCTMWWLKILGFHRTMPTLLPPGSPASHSGRRLSGSASIPSRPTPADTVAAARASLVNMQMRQRCGVGTHAQNPCYFTLQETNYHLEYRTVRLYFTP